MKMPKLVFKKKQIEDALILLSVYKAFGEDLKHLQDNPAGLFKNSTLDDFFAEVFRNDKNIKKLKNIEINTYKKYGLVAKDELKINLDEYTELLLKMSVPEVWKLNGILYLYNIPKNELTETLKSLARYYLDKAKGYGHIEKLGEQLETFDRLMMLEVKKQIEKTNPNVTVFAPFVF